MSDGPSNTELIKEARHHISLPWVTDGDALRVGRLADALDATTREMHARELHHFEVEQAIEHALNLIGDIGPEARRILTAAIGTHSTGPHAKPLGTSPEPVKSGLDSSHMDHTNGSAT